MPQTVLALEVDASELKAAVVEVSFRDYRVLGLYRDAVVADGSSVAEQLKAFLAKHDLPTDATVLSAVPGESATWRRLHLPFKDRKRLEQTIPFELESQVPFSLEDAVIDYHVLSRSGEGSDVIAALVGREDLQIHLHTLEEAGLDPKIVDVGPLAAVNALDLAQHERPKDFVFVAGGGRRLLVALYRDGVLVGLRTILVPEVNTEAENEHAPRDVAAVATRLVAEIRWTLNAMNEGHIEAHLPCWLWGYGEAIPLLGPRLAEALQLDVRGFEDGPSRRLPQPWQESVGAFVVPLGLALREVKAADACGVNLRRGEFSYHRMQDEFRAALWRTAGLAAVVLLMIVGHTFAEHERLLARDQVLRAELGKVLAATLPDARPNPDPVGYLRNIIETEQRKLGMLGDVVPIDGATAIDALRELAVAVPPELKIDIDEFTMDTGQIRIRATSDAYETVDAIKQSVEVRGYFAAVEVKNVKSERDGGVSFLLQLALGRAVTS